MFKIQHLKVIVVLVVMRLTILLLYIRVLIHLLLFI